MRITVIGGGLAGTALAWRLAEHRDARVRLVLGTEVANDATAASGGMIRGYESDPDNARLAVESLRALRCSPVLREWSGYREIGSLYLSRRRIPKTRIAELERSFPGSPSVVDGHELRSRFGVDISETDGTALYERDAGYFSPEGLRRHLRADVMCRGGSVLFSAARDLRTTDDGRISYLVGDSREQAEVVIVAAGSWSHNLLARNGYPGQSLWSKAIQVGTYTVRGHGLPPFVDECTGLYGRPVDGGRMLLGLATDRWDVMPGPCEVDGDHERRAQQLIAQRFPGLGATPVGNTVAVTDAYAPDNRLRLRSVEPGSGLFTFTGGSGGAAKTALAAAAAATRELLGGRVGAAAVVRS